MVFDEVAVLGQVAVKRVLGLERQCHLPGGWGFEQLPDVAQAHGAVGHCLVACGVDGSERVDLGQADEPHDRAQSDRPLGQHDASSPLSSGSSQGFGSALPMGQLAFDRSVAATQSKATGEPPRFESRMDGDLLEPHVEDAHFTAVPPRPDGLTDVLGWDEVQGAFDLDVAVPVDGSLGLGEHREEVRRKREQRRLFGGEAGGDLLAGGAVDASIGDRAFPLVEVLVLGRQTREGTSAKGVVLHIRDTVLDLALVLRGPGAARQDGAPVMLGEAGQLGVEARIEPVGLKDCRLEVVEIEGPGDTAEGTPCVLQTTDELLGILPEEGLAVGLSGEAQNHPKDPGTAAHAADRIDHPGTGTEVDLGFLTRLDLDAPDAVWDRAAQASHEAFDRLVGSGEPDLDYEVLVDALGAQAGLELGRNECRMGRAMTRASRIGNRGWDGSRINRQRLWQTGGEGRRKLVGTGQTPGGRNGG